MPVIARIAMYLLWTLAVLMWLAFMVDAAGKIWNGEGGWANDFFGSIIVPTMLAGAAITIWLCYANF